jgi:hypothetical protein
VAVNHDDAGPSATRVVWQLMLDLEKKSHFAVVVAYR